MIDTVIDVGTRYLEHLSEEDLRFLADAAGDAGSFRADGPAHFRAHPDLVEPALAADETFARTFDSPAETPGLTTTVSPFLVFAVVVQRGIADVAEARYTEERIGPRRRVPLLDVGSLVDFCADGDRRLFVIEHLASYTRIASGPVWVRRGNRWRRQRFSEVDPGRLAAMLGVVSEREQTGIYRRLGDLALFLAGVFPDHVTGRELHPLELERLLRSLPGSRREPLRADEIERILGTRGSAGLLEWLGPRWYRQAAAGTPIPALARLLDDVAARFEAARRFLNFVTDRYLFPRRDRWFSSPN
ncbi:MAG: hypothetical protein ACREJR_07140 [Candidatus Rokuibacteriota bacterium]